MPYHLHRLPLIIALIIAVGGFFALQSPAQATLRLRQVGGYGIVLRETPTFEYGSLDSEVNGTAREGEIVYLNGWQIGVYHVGDLRWVAASDVQPIIDFEGQPLVDWVQQRGKWYFMNGNGKALRLPPPHMTEAEKFLANPDIDAPIIYEGSYVPVDEVTELVDTSQVTLRSQEAVVATVRVTDLYDFIYLRAGPSWDAPEAEYNAYAGEVLTAYEVRDGMWYRIGDNVWAPARSGSEVYLVTENVRAYAPPEYYNGGKWIAIDLNRQRLTAWEGNDVVISSPVKTGKYGYYTPAGNWNIYEKVPNERMAGSDYDLMDVSWTMYFTPNRIAIHTAYWHNNYNGRPGSHGCVNTPADKAKQLFMWAPTGTTIITHNPYVFDAIDIADANRWNQFNR
jgi:lipoprotein-anchoring transpeptidase ErfK/SrfK